MRRPPLARQRQQIAFAEELAEDGTITSTHLGNLFSALYFLLAGHTGMDYAQCAA